MKLRVVELIKQNFIKDNSAQIKLRRNRIKADIEENLKKYLVNLDDELIFEAIHNVSDVLVVMDDIHGYTVVQISETLFSATLTPVEIDW